MGTNKKQEPKGSPVHSPGHVYIIHEAFDIKREVSAVAAHKFPQLFTLLIEAQNSPDFGLDIQLIFSLKLGTKMFH